MAKGKKRHASMKKKSSWRKNTEFHKEVEEFLEEQRLQERIGGYLIL